MRTAIFTTKGAPLDSYSGQRVDVLHVLDSERYNFVRVGTMYAIRFDSGAHSTAFADELTKWSKDE